MLNAQVSTIAVPCGADPTLVELRCLPAPQCVYWDKARSEWSSEGCTSLGYEDGEATTVRCQCRHLSDFSIVLYTSQQVKREGRQCSRLVGLSAVE